MRDDLHHSFPLSSPWRSVVRAACSEGMGWDTKAKLERVAWSEGGAWVDTPWESELKAVLSSPGDLFGIERTLAELRSLEGRCPSVAAKRALDCAFVEVQQGGTGPAAFTRVKAGSIMLAAEDGIENAVARVAAESGRSQASQLRERLERGLSQCDFSGERPSRKAARKRSVQEGLAISLELRE